MLRLFFFCAVLALSSPRVAAAGENNDGSWDASTSFTIPSSPDRCTAIASFRSGSQTLLLGLESRPTSDDYLLLIGVVGELKRPTWETSRNYLGGKRLESDFVAAERGSQPGTMFYRIPVERAELVAAGTNPELRLESKLLKLRLLLADLDASLSNLDDCDSKLLASWGYSPDFQSQLASYPRPEKPVRAYTSAYDYPGGAARAGVMGDVHALIAVSAKGRATDCRIVRSLGRRDLDQMTCKILKDRVPYVPAKTKAGEAIDAPSYYAFRWELPKE
jgi:TonB family protein